MIITLKKYWGIGLLAVLLAGVYWLNKNDKQIMLSPEAPWIQVEKPLEKYRFADLRRQVFKGSEVKIDRLLTETDNFNSYLFFYKVNGQKISGQLNIPKGEGPFPVVIMIRGYVDAEIYQTGVGTKNAAGYFANQGFITLAPDFLGFGESEMPPNNSLEERLMRPGQILELIASVKSLDKAAVDKIAMWGHSNGGQIALSVLEISGKKIPTSLWAPVSKPFPYSILYYTDDFDDYGKALRKVLAGFEAQYDADDYSIHKYYHWIEAPIQIHQGTADEAVPLKWSQHLQSELKDLDKEVYLFVYPGADHNMKSGWDEAIAKDVGFFRENL